MVLEASPRPLVASNVVMRLLIGIIQTVLILGIGAALFGVTIIGSLPLAAGVIVLGALMTLMLVLRPSGITGGRELRLPRRGT